MIDLVLTIHKHDGILYGQINLGGDNFILDHSNSEIKLMAKIKRQLLEYEGLNENDFTIRKDYI